MKYKVSVIVPVYNVEKYIGECLESLVNQTLEDMEIIVVNDGSTDDSQNIIDIFAKRYGHKIKTYIKKNGGLSDSRNYGISKASGKYLGFVDGDDFVDLNMFNLLFEKASSLDADAIICDYYEYDNESKEKILRNCTLENSENINILMDPELLCKCSASACNKLFKTDLFSKNFFPCGQNYEDSAIIYNILAQCDRIAFCNFPLYYYRINRKGSLTNVFINNSFDIFKSCDSIINYYQQNDLLKKFYDEVEYICVSNIHNVIVFSKNSINILLRWKFVKTAFKYLNMNFPNWKNNKYFINTTNKIKIKCFTPIFYFIQKKYILYQYVLLFYSFISYFYNVYHSKGNQNDKL